MLLEKLKKHGGKLMFFVMNAVLVFSAVLFMRQKNVEEAKSVIAEADLQNYKSATDYALDAQQRILTDKATKVNSVANNPGTVERQVGVSVTKTIPAVTKTVTVTKPASSSTSSKTTTKKS
ncbi:MAG: hypothetical protein US57_C0011G0051 [Candidatus Moranbacteria bacterium GW2011_GWC2_37_73]|nr:MAG: hypothetical protein UR95_C0006G0128 [Parcubacteria group bacterium GW2011_GWC1_36_108]KKQ00150.1 MAG: hypothetical protein US09_C0019G0010 [Candidatus Moranbacteria bacterium GW2011_GWD1_36_198]KKQ00204.1 MAG: hypothetical protein US10_C0038G0012 [Candidatus Moranbacteria bacterium GW2011_GWD2_36_198]KKQ39563.1 MAG: hypothetical protein US57_C0011G0051 [Candidatus Moranbacteria bacterium GW2011_GWC2_37_73]HAS00101.1 hypothetical protein [Candidatus Moranbacteria bacterium]